MPRRLAIEAIHREDAIRGDEPEARAGGRSQLCSQVGHVVISVAMPLRFAKADAIDDGRVVQFVGNDGVLGAEQRFEEAAIGIEAGGVEDRVFGAEELAEPLFEILVRFLRAADEAHAARPYPQRSSAACAAAITSGCSGQAEIVVRAEIQNLAPAGHADARLLRRGNDALVFEEAAAAQPRESGARWLPGQRERWTWAQCGGNVASPWGRTEFVAAGSWQMQQAYSPAAACAGQRRASE